MGTLYDRNGGEAGLRPMIEAFYGRVLASPRLAGYFDGVDMTALVDHQVKFVAWVMGGPVHYGDEDIRRAHAELGITRAEFLEMVEALRLSLHEGGMAAADVDHVMRAVMRREPLIVDPAALDTSS